MTKYSLISIIIPVYKVEKYISRCLDSILNQTFQDFEVILVNDASPDQSMEIAEDYAKRDNRIRILHNEENSGAAWSRMVGYSNARGTFITFCDPDDFLPENALEVLYNEIKKDSNVDIGIGDFQRVYPDGRMSAVHHNKLLYGTDKKGLIKSTLKGETPQYLWNKIYRKKLFENSDIVTYKHFSKSSDEFLLFQIFQKCHKVITIPKVVYYYFDNEESASKNKANLHAINAIITSQNYIEKLYGNDPELQLYVQKRKLNNYSKLLTVAGKDRSLLQFIFKNNIDKLFTPWNLLKYFHKSKAIRVSYFYLKARFYYLVSHSK